MLKLGIIVLTATAVNIALTTPAIARTRLLPLDSAREAEYFRVNFLSVPNTEVIDDVQQLTQTITQGYANAGPLIDSLIRMNFDKLNCKSYFNSYKQTGKEVINILKLYYPEAFEDATPSLTNEFSAHPEVLENLDNNIIEEHNKEAQRNQHKTCTGNECIGNLIRDGSSTAPLINGTYFQHPKYEEFRKKERNLFNDTVSCLQIDFYHQP